MERRGSWLDSHGEDEGPGRRCWDHRSLHGADRAGPGFTRRRAAVEPSARMLTSMISVSADNDALNVRDRMIPTRVIVPITYEATARIAVDQPVKNPLERSACSPRKEMPTA